MQTFPLERVEGFHHGQAAPGRWRLPRRHRRALPLALARGFGLLGAGCQGPSAFALPEHLQIAIAYGGVSDAVARTSLERLAGQMAQEFMQNNPGTNLHPDQ